MPTKSKNKSINVSKKWKTWHIKSESKTSILLSYCEIFPYYQLMPLSIILCYLGKPKVEPTGTLTYHFFPGPPKYHQLLAPHPAEPHPTDRSSLFSLEKQKSLKINIAYYFLETLASPHKNTWHRRGGPTTQTIDNFSLNNNHWRSMKHIWKTLISLIERGLSTKEEM